MAEILNMHPLRVLLVEDSDSDATLVRHALNGVHSQEFDITHAMQAETALVHLAETAFDIGLLDMSLPGLSGLDALHALQTTAPSMPIIVLTGSKDETLAISALKHGAQDFLDKDHTNAPLMRRAMHYAIERKRLEEKLIHLANYDQLTGLVNRGLFAGRLEMALARVRRSGAGVGVLFLDLDRFKQVNDTLGHDAGDALLKAVAKELKQCLRDYDTVARFGGDEFAVLLEDVQQLRDCARTAQKVVECITHPYALPGGNTAEIGVSIGIATSFGREALSAATLMKHADTAMYRAKAVSGNAYRFHTQEMTAEVNSKLQLEQELRKAVQNGELKLMYQPRLTLGTNDVCGAEALVRWEHPQRGTLMPADFTALAEDSGLMPDLGAWVLGAVCRDIRQRNADGLPPVRISVNLSATQLDSKDFPAILNDTLRSSGVSPDQLAVEIAEASFARNPEQRLAVLADIQATGVAIYLDNFGSSVFSLRPLQSQLFDRLKMDGSLLAGIGETDRADSIVQAIIELAHRLALRVVASGVETTKQQQCLTSQHCDEMQGFVFSRPLQPAHFATWLEGRNRLSKYA